MSKQRRKCVSRNCEQCGVEFQARVDSIASGYARFCSKDCAWKGFSSRKHGHSERGHRTATYRTWKSMHWRCNANEPRYEHVSVCERWRSFENFLADMGERPENKTLDRYPDPFGNYEPENCRWATSSEQSRNRRQNRTVEFQGRTQCVTAWSEETGIPVSTLRNRLNKGWNTQDALTRPLRPQKHKPPLQEQANV